MTRIPRRGVAGIGGAALAIDVGAAYERYGPMVLRRCRRLLRDEEAAVDAMQDTFVQLVRHGARLEERGTSSLLYTMATHVCLNALRSKRRRPEDAVVDEVLMRIACAHDALAESAGRLWLARVLGRVSPSTRAMAVMHLVDGLTHEEIAEAVGLSVSGVRKRLRALRGAVAELDDDGKAA